MADYPVSIELVRRKLIEMRDVMDPYAKYVLDMAISKLEGFPAMDAVHGTWVEVKQRGWHRQGFYETAMIACSECHNVPVPHVESSHEHGATLKSYRWLKTKHCPNCGLKMDLVEDTDAGNTM